MKKVAFMLFVSVMLVITYNFVFANQPDSKSSKIEKWSEIKTIKLPPNKEVMLKYESKTKKWSIKKTAVKINKFSPKVQKALEKTPAWLHKDLKESFQRLLRRPIYTMGLGTPTVFDINEDKIPDLIIGTHEGKVRTFIGPDFIENTNITNNIQVQGLATPVGYDYDNDNHLDLYISDGQGLIYKYKHIVNENTHSFQKDGTAFPDSYGTDITMAVVDFEENGKTTLLVCNNKGECIPDKKIWQAPVNPGKVRMSTTTVNEKPVLVFVDDTSFLTLVDPKTKKVIIDHPLKNAIIGTSRFCFGDVTGDGLDDMVIVNIDGEVLFVENTGTKKNTQFAFYNKDYVSKFNMNVGFSPIPYFTDLNNDGKDDLVVGNANGELKAFLAPNWKETSLEVPKTIANVSNISPSRMLYGDRFFCYGSRSGKTVFVSQHGETELKFPKNISIKYSSPAIGRIKGDLDVVVGSASGKLFLFKGTDLKYRDVRVSLKYEGEIKLQPAPTKQDFEIIDGNEKNQKNTNVIKANLPIGGGYLVPRIVDINEDGKNDIVLGCKDGSLRVFLAPEWKEDTEILSHIVVTSYSAPAFGDVNGDGLKDILVGKLSGELYYYENIGKPGSPKWQEKYSWRPVKETQKKYIWNKYGRYCELKHIKGLNGEKMLEDIADIIIKSKKEYLDEIAYCFAHLPPEIIRAMHNLNQLSNIVDNAKMIYEIAGQIKYAKLVEKEDCTILSYAKPDETFVEYPKDIYYRYVVYPRVHAEIPAKIDSTYWSNPPEYYGQTFAEWQRHDPKESIYQVTKNSRFWRSALPYDNTYNQKLIDAVKDAKSMRDAFHQTHHFLCKQRPNSFMTFGYLSNDAQPMVIYQKHYGSCGEQGILASAVGRTMLIPTVCILKSGEDHFWNEIYLDGKWVHWDVNGTPTGGLNCPWRSAEGFGHNRKCSMIWRLCGDDSAEEAINVVSNPKGSGWNTRGTGYTDTANVTFIVKDKNGNPIDGAMLSFFSHWVNRYSGRVWTDINGKVTVNLGYQPRGGYTIDIVTPYGCTGFSNFVVYEGKKYEVEVNVPGEKKPVTIPETESILMDGSYSAKFIIKDAYQYRPPMHTGASSLRIDPYVGKKIGYYGTIFEKCKVNAVGPISAKVYIGNKIIDIGKQGNFKFDGKEDIKVVFKSLGTEFTSYEIDFTTMVSAPHELPTLEINEDVFKNLEIKTGQKTVFNGKASDNLNLAKLEMSFNGGRSWIDITSSVQKDGSWKYEWDTGLGGPLVTGEYELLFRASDNAPSSVVSKKYSVSLSPTQEFKNQKIFQDNPDDPLPKVSWIYGPFVLDEDERCIDIATKCESKDCDIDIYLYFDKNNNGKIDGPEELSAKSTTPYADEHILKNDAQKGTYWLYCQGWEVKKEFELFDVNLSFKARPRLITEITPTGYVKNIDVITAKVNSPAGFEKPAKVSVSLENTEKDSAGKHSSFREIKIHNGTLVIPVLNILWPSEEVTLSDKIDTPLRVAIEVEDCAGNKDVVSFPIISDTKSPEFTVKPKLPKKIQTDQIIQVFAKDEYDIKEVTIDFYEPGTGNKMTDKAERIGCGYCLELNDYEPPISGNNIPLTRDRSDKTKFSGRMLLHKIKPGKYDAVWKAVDIAGNKTVATQRIEIIHPPLMFVKIEPDLDKVMYRIRPVIYGAVETDAKLLASKVKAFIDNIPVDVVPTVREKEFRFFTKRELKPGEHILRLEVEDTEGRKAKTAHKFRVHVAIRKLKYEK